MVKRCGPPSQGWRTFLRNHAPDIAATDLFVVPTIGFDLLYALVIVRLDRRQLVWINATQHPTVEWIARQLTEAFPWDVAPRYLIRDQDDIYGVALRRRLEATGPMARRPGHWRTDMHNSGADGTRGTNQRRHSKLCLPMGTTAANWNGDFGTSPFFGQLFGQVSACLYKWACRR
jgi:hypothetical protein